MKSQSLKTLCQFIIKSILIITWNKREKFLSNKKYEIIEKKERRRFVPRLNLFFKTEIDKHVNPKERKEEIEEHYNVGKVRGISITWF